MYNFVSTSVEETKKIAYELASKLKSGDVIVLTGDLGVRENTFCARNIIFLGLGRRSF